MTIPYTFQRTDRGDTVSAFVNGSIKVANQTHPAWGLIVAELNKNYPNEVRLERLFDRPTEAIRENISEYSDNVTIEGDDVLLKGQVITGPLPRKILATYGAGGSVKALVKFLERLDKNPSHRSREQLFAYLQKHDFQITENGHFIAYKGLTNQGLSVHSGTAYVNGSVVEGQIPNEVGSVISMPRSEISDDPNVACHVGLHAGAWSYANGFGNGNTAKVEVDPADVVSVPADNSQRKLRVCRYKVLELNLVEPNDPESFYDGEHAYADPFDVAYEDGFAEGYEAGQEDAAEGVYR